MNKRRNETTESWKSEFRRTAMIFHFDIQLILMFDINFKVQLVANIEFRRRWKRIISVHRAHPRSRLLSTV
jgi:hypothetical protein